MSLSTVITLALVLKKITRKGTRKNFRLKKGPAPHVEDDDDQDSYSSAEEKIDCSSPSPPVLKNEIQYTKDTKHPASSAQPSTASLPSPPAEQADPCCQETVLTADDVINKDNGAETPDLLNKAKEGQDETEEGQVVIRDFAYPITSPLHHGRAEESRSSRSSQVSLSSSEFTGRHGRALYDFSPETEYEIGMKAGQLVWVQYRQCPGWLVADVEDETGLIPESYIEFI
ncbi:hypothetical protein BCR43DRAFT_493051 [Syncephalastrum racemosum]|uniref:SH3 domain-containing protein n=1 Tax=Syncephalastrum racemosum TaxID=13706 RepID=A0A1X2HA01_SYNRA|nr:hypothetical protein BCR43DRAFT_493051 [Syncephalastrum racemosum]